MSRIHEALKKAEQERAAVRGGAEQPTFTAAPVVDAPVFEEAPSAAPLPETMGIGTAPSFSTPFSQETLLARCPQTEWKPDPATMLFMNGDDTKRGPEEYRTLRSRLYDMREGDR